MMIINLRVSYRIRARFRFSKFGNFILDENTVRVLSLDYTKLNKNKFTTYLQKHIHQS